MMRSRFDMEGNIWNAIEACSQIHSQELLTAINWKSYGQ